MMQKFRWNFGFMYLFAGRSGKEVSRVTRIFHEIRDGSTLGLRAKIAFFERIVSHKSAVASARPGCAWLHFPELTAQVVDQPDEKAHDNAHDEAGDEREIECALIAPADDVSGQAPESQREFCTEVEQCAGDHERCADRNE